MMLRAYQMALASQGGSFPVRYHLDTVTCVKIVCMCVRMRMCVANATCSPLVVESSALHGVVVMSVNDAAVACMDCDASLSRRRIPIDSPCGMARSSASEGAFAFSPDYWCSCLRSMCKWGLRATWFLFTSRIHERLYLTQGQNPYYIE
jgi:hypothetical protein